MVSKQEEGGKTEGGEGTQSIQKRKEVLDTEEEGWKQMIKKGKVREHKSNGKLNPHCHNGNKCLCTKLTV